MTSRRVALLSKLEDRALTVLRCDSCRYYAPVTSFAYSVPAGADPSDYLEQVCRWCGWRVVYTLAKTPPHEREALRLLLGESGGERFRDPRVFAAGQWCAWHRHAQRSLETYRLMASGEWKPKPARAKPAEGKPTKALRLLETERAERAELKARADAFMRRMREREKKLYGPHSFPLYAEVMAAQAEHLDTFYTSGKFFERVPVVETQARDSFKAWRVVALCEGALWGGPRPDTTAALGELTEAIERLEAERDGRVRAFEARESEDAARRAAAGIRPRPVVEPAPVRLEPPAPVPARRPEPDFTPVDEGVRAVPVPFTVRELREMARARFPGEEPWRSNVRMVEFVKAIMTRDTGAMFKLAGVSDDERNRRGCEGF